ncbi:uncharacterized protein FA14DRAFT_175080 [Meira miltonrushii]|uniref:RING-type domain-containing protein n=1 Tax=Meira miltonrushii TaxID=1280837 RepID=A0A316V470_9BASI|nr:uncharacterized protein FA14DRAFT_175080 [Meira miltonrushii]PWN32252.1 hypothetical protein FA14DRAFT_175080 [Meira miltonrushii]
MPKREGPEDGGLLRPPGSSSRSRPTSAGNQRGPYSGNAAFASSSSSVNSILRPADASTAAIIQNPTAANQVGGGPVDATEAPFLTSLEAHFGRMTLTAPDNMLRRKQEEKEKRQKARKRKAERAEAAILALSGVTDTTGQRSVTPTQISNTAIPNTVYTTEILGTARRRPGLTASRSSSNLQTITSTNANETLRSRSPTRPPRPHSAQNATRSDTSPERRPSATIATGTASGSNGATRPATSQETRKVRRKQRPQRQAQGATSGEEHAVHTQNVSSPRRNQRTASGGAARSAVRAEALRRATQRRRDIYADLSTMGLPGASDSEPEEGPPPFPANATRPISPPQLPVDGEEWTEEMRRRQEEYFTNKPPDSPPPAFRSEDEDAGPSHTGRRGNADDRSISTDEDSDNQLDESISEERRLWEEDVAAGFTFEERLERERQRRSESERDTSTPQALPNLSLGQAVMAARARRNAPEERTSVPVEPTNPEPESSIQQTLRKTAHRRTASEGKDEANQPPVQERHASRNAAVGTGRGLGEQNEREVLNHHGKVTKIRPRPASESHSRFRDDASAAANRRLALWASAKAQASGVQAQSAAGPSSMLRSSSENQATTPELQSIMSEMSEQSSRQRPERKQTSSSSGVDEGPESSDSEAEWAKEEKQFKRMQRKASQNAQAIVDSSDEEDAGSDVEASMPGALHSERSRRAPVQLPELGKVGSSVPRAPPPLVLGRSRGGAAFDSSSESSSESDVNRMEEDEDSNSDSPPEADDGPSAPKTEGEITETTIDKGKQPVRPLPNLPSSESVVHYSTSEGDVNSIRAGMFEEDGASSRDFTDEEGNDDFQNTSSTLHADRPAVQNRLKDLFAARLSPSELGEPSTSQSASRASLERLFDVPIDGRAGQLNDDARRPSMTEQLPHDTRQASAETSSRPQWANDASSIRNRQTIDFTRTTPRMESMNEQQARKEALNSLSQLQRNQDSLPAGVDRDSLAALERLLARTTPSNARATTSNGSEPLMAEPSKLMRSGAIGNRQMTSSSFSNPRSINAPRPLGRLPTITDATRHFPPSQARRMEEESSRMQNISRRPASMMGTPSWMAYIPQQERARLPNPMQPDVRLHEGGENVDVPPRNPSPTRGSRIQAMVNRFEQNAGSDRDSMERRPSSPTKNQPDLQRQSSQSSLSRVSSEQPQAREEPLRRRPPPPPPLFGQRRNGSISRVASNEEQQPPVQLSHSSSQASMARALHTIAVERQRQLSSSSSSAGSSAFNSPVLPPRPTFSVNSGAAQQPPQLPPRFGGFPERQRSRPLPIPPNILPNERTETPSPPAVPRRVSEQLRQEIREASPVPSQDRVETPEPPVQDVGEEVQRDSPVNDTIVEETDNTPSPTASNSVAEQPSQNNPRRIASLGITDLDIFASRLAEERLRNTSGSGGDGQENGEEDDGQEQGRDTYDDLHLLAEFLGPAKAPGLTQDEMERLPVGKVEVLRRRIVGKREDGRDKVKLALAVAGVKVERCAVCLVQFKEGNLACVFPCLHVLHEQCAAKLLRNTKQCPTCRSDVV